MTANQRKDLSFKGSSSFLVKSKTTPGVVSLGCVISYCSNGRGKFRYQASYPLNVELGS